MRNASPVVLGEIIADKYQIEGVIGEGGMGLVVSAWHLGLRQRVAIKLLLSDGGQIEDAALERFQREARAAARIRSEHVCRVLDVGMLPAGTPYLVLEYLEGCDLSDELSRRGHLPANEAIGYVLEACEALAEAHVSGIIHRDLKPANLFLSRRSNGSRCLKLLDFGVSKSVSESSLAQFSLTKTSSIIGSPIYMSPEQLNSAKDVDARTDIWAMGALTYELLTGRPPFYGETIPQLVSQVLHSEPETFAALGITAPGGLELVLRKALSKKREDRFATVGEFATAIGPFAPEDSMSVSRILRVRASSDVRDPLPETLNERDARKTPISRKTPLSGPRLDPRATPPQATPSRVPTTLVVDQNDSRKSSWRWAWVALLFVGLAGLAAALSRRGSSAETAEAASNADSRPAFRSDAGVQAQAETERAQETPRVAAPPQLPEVPSAVAPPVVAPPSTTATTATTPEPVVPVSPPQSEPPKSADDELPSGRSVPRVREASGRSRVERPLTPGTPSAPVDHESSNFGGRR